MNLKRATIGVLAFVFGVVLLLNQASIFANFNNQGRLVSPPLPITMLFEFIETVMTVGGIVILLHELPFLIGFAPIIILIIFIFISIFSLGVYG